MLKRNVADNILSSGHGGGDDDESRLSGRAKKREKEEMIDFPSE